MRWWWWWSEGGGGHSVGYVRRVQYVCFRVSQNFSPLPRRRWSEHRWDLLCAFILCPTRPYNTQVFKILAALANRTTLNMDAIDDGQTDADALDNLDKILAIPLNLNYEFEIDDLLKACVR